MSATRTVRTQTQNLNTGRGRGRGRGGRRGGSNAGGDNWRARGAGQRLDSAPAERTETQRTPKPPLTHFIALPIGHHPSLRESITTLTTSLLQSTPPITGLHPSILIPPRRLHLTLGVMSLGRDESQPGRTVAAALALLADLRPRILEMIGQDRLNVELACVDVMKPERGDLEKAHVMWAGPMRNGLGTKLREVCLLIQRVFTEAGLLVDERRELKLHCTLLNTIHRKPRSNGPRVPFSYAAILRSPAFREISLDPVNVPGQSVVDPAPQPSSRQNQRGPVSVDLGTWSVDEVQICEMGSWGPEGEYVSVGGIAV